MAEPAANVAPLLHTADVLEAINDAIPDATAMVWRDIVRTRREYEDRSSRLAQALSSAGLRVGSSVALYLHNSPAYLEGHYAALKMRAVPVNANYRYKEEELAYLLDNCDAEAVLFDEVLAPRVAAIMDQLPQVKLFIEVGDSGVVPGSISLEETIRSHPPMPRIARDPNDLNMTYTGGTTGMPKGVRNTVGKISRGVLMIAASALGAKAPHSPQEAGEQARALNEAGRAPISVVGPPFMHATGLVYGAHTPLMSGGMVVMLPSWSFDAAMMLRTIEQYRANSVTIAGDVMAQPIAYELERALREGKPYDISSVRAVYSSGMIWTAGPKHVILRHAPDAKLIDVVGSSEGHVGTSIATKDHVPDTGVFTPNPTTKVLNAEGKPVVPGSGEAGMLACSGDVVGAGYHKDPEKSEKTYRVIDGVNYVMAGDWAIIEADGSYRFIGRGSSCINTGGEKVFAEEVENVILRMPEVVDCIVVGIPDARWGQSVAAVVQRAPDASQLNDRAVQEWARQFLAGYKIPRRIVFVEKGPRAPNGKADLAGAQQIVLEHLASEAASAPKEEAAAR